MSTKADALAAMLKIADKELATARAQKESWQRTRADYLEQAETAVAEWEALKAQKNKNANQRHLEQEKHKAADQAFKKARWADDFVQSFTDQAATYEIKAQEIRGAMNRENRIAGFRALAADAEKTIDSMRDPKHKSQPLPGYETAWAAVHERLQQYRRAIRNEQREEAKQRARR